MRGVSAVVPYHPPQKVEKSLLKVPPEQAVDERVDGAARVVEESGHHVGVAGQSVGHWHAHLVQFGHAEGGHADEVGQHNDQQAPHRFGRLAVLHFLLRLVLGGSVLARGAPRAPPVLPVIAWRDEVDGWQRAWAGFDLLHGGEHLTVGHGEDEPGQQETEDESHDDVGEDGVPVGVPLDGACRFPVVVVDPPAQDGSQAEHEALQPGVGDERQHPGLGDVHVVTKREVDGREAVQADEAQRQHGDDDEAVVGPAHDGAPHAAQHPPAVFS